VKEFTTAVDQANEDQQPDVAPTTFTIDGNAIEAYRPGDGQLAILIAMTTRHSSDEEHIAGLINFFVSLLDSDGRNYVVQRLLDRRDKFGIVQVQAICNWLIGEWSGRPTRPSTGSTGSRSSGGRKSTQRTPALTS
jgi:hypothetical protein